MLHLRYSLREGGEFNHTTRDLDDSEVREVKQQCMSSPYALTFNTLSGYGSPKRTAFIIDGEIHVAFAIIFPKMIWDSELQSFEPWDE